MQIILQLNCIRWSNLRKVECTVNIGHLKEGIVRCSTGCKNRYRKYQGSCQPPNNQRDSHHTTRSGPSKVKTSSTVNRLTQNSGFPKPKTEPSRTYSRLLTLRMFGKTYTLTNFPKTQSSKPSELKICPKNQLSSRTHHFLERRPSHQKP